MDDVTQVMQGYRECVRHVWNVHFAAAGRPDWDDVSAFCDAAAVLFRALVLRRLGYATVEHAPLSETVRDPLLFLEVVLEPEGEILVNREQRSGYWDHPLTKVKNGEIAMAFLGYFDWALLEHRDLAYYRVRVVRSTDHPEVVGKDALVPIGPNVRVMCEAAQQSDEADEASVGAPSSS